MVKMHICDFKELKMAKFTGRLTSPQKHSNAVTVVDLLTSCLGDRDPCADSLNTDYSSGSEAASLQALTMFVPFPRLH